MGKIGNLWFEVGLHDATDKDYEKLRKKLYEEFKKPVDVPVKVDANAFEGASKGANQLLSSINRVQGALARLQTLEDRIQMQMRLGAGGEGYERALQKIRQVRKELEALDRNDAVTVGLKTGSAFTKQLNDIRLLVQEQDKLNKLQERSARTKMTENQAKMRREMELTNVALGKQGRLASEVRNQINGYLSVYAAERFLRSVIEIGGEFEKQRIALRSILGEAAQAETIFSQIKTLAVESPFQFQELTSYAKQLSAYSIPYEELYDTTKRLADISAGLGVDMGRIILAYGQVRSAAFLRGQELRQFTEAGIPLVDELAKKFSQLEGKVVSAADVFDRISRRMVSFEMVKEVLWDLTDEGGKFFNMQEELAESLAGKWSNLGDSFQIMLADIAEGNNGALKGALELLTDLMNNWRKVAAVIAGVVMVYGTYKTAVTVANALQAISIARHEGLAVAARNAAASLIAEGTAAANMNRQTASMIVGVNRLKAAFMGIGKIGWISIILSAIAGIVNYISTARREANRLNKELGKMAAEGNLAFRNNADGYSLLVNELGKATKGTKEYDAILNKIKSRYGEYIGFIEENADAYEYLTSKINEVTEALKEQARASYMEQSISTVRGDYASDMEETMKNISENLQKEFDLSQTQADKIASVIRDKLEEAVKNGLNPENMDYNIIRQQIDDIAKDLGIKIDIPQQRMMRTANGTLTPYGEVPKTLKEVEELASVFKSLNDGIAEAERNANLYFGETGKTLEKEKEKIDGWREAVIDFIKSNEGLDEFIPKNDESRDSWIERVLKRYESFQKILEQAQKVEKESPMLQVEDEIENTEKSLNRIKPLIEQFNLWGFAKQDKSKDPTAEAWKERIRLMKEAMAMYEKFAALEGAGRAKERVNGTENFRGLFTGGFSAESYRHELEKLRDEFGRAGNKEGLTEVVKLIAEADADSLKQELDKMKKEIERTARRWDLYDTILGATGNKSIAMNVAFGGKVAFESEIEEMKELLRNSIDDEGVTVNELLGMDEGKVKAEYGHVADLVKRIREEMSAASAKELEDAAKLVGKYRDYEAQIVEIKRKANEDIAKLEAQRAAFGDEATDNAIEERRREGDREVTKVRFEQFKESPEYMRAFDDLAGVSEATLESLLEKLSRFKAEAAASFDVENMREYAKLMEEIEDALGERNPFGAFVDSLKEVADARKVMEQARNAYNLAVQARNASGTMADWANTEEAQRKLNEATDEYLVKLAKMMEAFGRMADAAGEFFGMLQNIGNVVGGEFGEIANEIADIGNNAIEAGRSVADMTSKLGNAIGGRAGGALAGAAGAAGLIAGGISAIVSIGVGIKRANDEWVKAENERVRTAIQTLDDYKRKLTEVKLEVEDDWGTNGFNNILRTMDALNEATDRYYELLGRNTRGSTAMASVLKYMHGYSDEEAARVLQTERESMSYITQKGKKGFLGIGGKKTKTQNLEDWVRENMGDELFNADGRLNLEIAEALLENADNLHGDTADILQNLVDQEELIREAEEQLRDQIVSVFGDLGTELSDILANAFRNGEVDGAIDDFKQSLNGVIEDFMMQMLMGQMMQPIFDQLAEDVKTLLSKKEAGWYDGFLQYIYAAQGNEEAGNMNAEELFAYEMGVILKEFAGDIEGGSEGVVDAMEAIQDVMAGLGFDLWQPDEEEGSTALRGSVENITEDTADLLASYVNAIRADVSVIRIDWDKTVNDLLPKMNVIASAQLSQLTQIAANTGRNAEIVEDIYDILKGNVNGTNKFAVK